MCKTSKLQGVQNHKQKTPLPRMISRQFQQLDLIGAHLVNPRMPLGHTAASHDWRGTDRAPRLLPQLSVGTLSPICPCAHPYHSCHTTRLERSSNLKGGLLPRKEDMKVEVGRRGGGGLTKPAKLFFNPKKIRYSIKTTQAGLSALEPKLECRS